MTTTGRYAVTYVGNGLVRLPRAGIFQTGTRALVDETVARIAKAHGSFAIEAIGADTLGLATTGQAPVVAAPAPTPTPTPPPTPAAPEPRRTKAQRNSAAVRVPARSEAITPTDPSAANAHTR